MATNVTKEWLGLLTYRLRGGRDPSCLFLFGIAFAPGSPKFKQPSLLSGFKLSIYAVSFLRVRQIGAQAAISMASSQRAASYADRNFRASSYFLQFFQEPR